MTCFSIKSPSLAAIALACAGAAHAGQAPGSASSPDIPISHRDRVYAAEQFSNQVSVIGSFSDSSDRKLPWLHRL